MAQSVELSIIVPIYNKVRFLEKCLRSIAEACEVSNINAEIILIDDGSTDGSGVLSDDYCKTHHNSRVIHTGNKGVSAARNMGLREAYGDYIAFVDADDEVITDSFVNSISNIDNELDILICGAIWGDGDASKCDLVDSLIEQDENEKPVFDYFLTGGV